MKRIIMVAIAMLALKCIDNPSVNEDTTGTVNQLQPQDLSSGDFFPLAAGNSWTLTSDQYDMRQTKVIAVVGDTVLNGLNYSVLENRYEGGGSQPMLIRIDSMNTIFLINGGMSSIEGMNEEIMLDTDAPDSQTYECGIFVIKVTRLGDVSTDAGTFENCIEFYVDVPSIEDVGRSFVIAPGVGFVTIREAWFSYLLESYRIDDEDTAGHVRDSTDEFLPLMAGNSWTLTSLGEKTRTRVISVVGDTVLNDLNYLVLKHVYEGGGSYIFFMRIDSLNNIFLINVAEGEIMLDNAAPDNQTYENGIYTIKVTRPGVVGTDAGTFENCIDFYIDDLDRKDEQMGFVIAPGVGFVTLYGAWFPPFRLVSYRIDGEDPADPIDCYYERINVK